MKIHQKGFLLIALSRANDSWDDDLVQLAQGEYGLTGSSAINGLYVALNELAAAGLIMRIEEKLAGRATAQARLSFRYRISEFGRTRMLETGLHADDVSSH
jgi:hypothetical protein